VGRKDKRRSKATQGTDRNWSPNPQLNMRSGTFGGRRYCSDGEVGIQGKTLSNSKEEKMAAFVGWEKVYIKRNNL